MLLTGVVIWKVGKIIFEELLQEKKRETKKGKNN